MEILEEKIKTCLHRVFGDCEECKRDYDSKVNNTNCPRYYEISLAVYGGRESEDE